MSSAHGAKDKRVFHKEARALRDAGLRVTHLCPTHDGEICGIEVVDGIRIRRYRASGGVVGRVFRLPRLVREALKEDSDVYHCNEVDSWLAGLVVGRLTGARIIFDVHEHYPSVFASRHLWAPLRPLATRLIKWLYSVFAPVTDGLVFAKRTVTADFPADHRVSALVRNLPPTSLLSGLPDPWRESGDRVVAIHTGGIGVARGWPQMLQAIAEGSPELSLYVLGEFIDGTGPEFERQVAELGLGERVVVESWLPFNEAFARLLDADIGLILFQPDIQNHVFASPHKLYDYMLAGLPVVAPKFAIEVAEIVDGYGCGLLVDSADASDVASALGRLVDSPDLRHAMGERGQKAVLEELNWEKESRKLLELYDRLGVSPARPLASAGGRS